METQVQTQGFFAACELKRKLPPSRATRALRRATLLAMTLVMLSSSILAAAQEHAGAAAGPAAEHEAAAHSMGDMLIALAWPLANFAIFCGILYYFLNGPLKTYLGDRSAAIRKDLVEAAELKASANAQLAGIEQKLQALPGELANLRTRGAEEIAAEEQRIAAAAAAERERLLEQTRREIALQVRLAKREILEHAADLSVQLATERLKKEITPADQARLVERYLDLVKTGHGPSSKPQA